MGGSLSIALRVLAIGGLAIAFAALLIFLVVKAKRGGKSARAIGVALMLFGWGNLRDPRNDTVAEAKDGRVRKGETSGDPQDRDS